MSDEIVQGREPARPPSSNHHRRSLLVGGAALAVLVAVGVISGVRHDHPGPPRPTTSTPSGADNQQPALRLTSTRCAHLDGTELTLGFGVANRGSGALTIVTVLPSFPLGGLTPDPRATPDVSDCPAPAAPVPAVLGPGESALLTVVLSTSDPRCVAPLPVDVEVLYEVPGDGSTIGGNLHVFPDLGGFDLPSDCS